MTPKQFTALSNDAVQTPSYAASSSSLSSQADSGDEAVMQNGRDIASIDDDDDTQNSEPQLSVHIPNPWPQTSASSSRPSVGPRSLSQRLTRGGTKVVAAAICTQNRRERSKSDKVRMPPSVTIEQAEPSPKQWPSPPQQDKTAHFRSLRQRNRPHALSTSAIEAPAKDLHIDTFLPLHLPPQKLCAERFPILATADDSDAALQKIKRQMPTRPATTGDIPSCTPEHVQAKADLRRSESYSSFASAETDGSWHGDDGDVDPDGQLARALAEQKRNGLVDSSFAAILASKLCQTDQGHYKDIHGHGPLQLSTSDYIDDEAVTICTPSRIIEGSIEDEGVAIKRHAGPLMSRIVEFLFNMTALEDSDHNEEAAAIALAKSSRLGVKRSSSQPAISLQDARNPALFSEMPPNRSRARTVAIEGAFDKQERALDSEMNLYANTFGLRSLWRWLLPDVDQYLDDNSQDLTMYRSDSLPSLASNDSNDELDDNIESDEILAHYYRESLQRTNSVFGLGSYEGTAVGDLEAGNDNKVLLAGANLASTSPRSWSPFLSMTSAKLNHVNDAVKLSPLWDDRITDEAYTQSWSSFVANSLTAAEAF